MDDQTKKVIINHISAIQAQCELLIWYLQDENDLSKKEEEKKITPFQGKKGECDQQCSKDEFINVSSFGGSTKLQCKRCSKLIGVDEID